MRLMGGGNLSADNEMVATTLLLRKTTDNGKVPELKRCQHPYITYNTNATEKISLSKQMYQFSQNTFGLLGMARAEANRTAKIFELENIETLPKRRQEQIVLERSARLYLDPKI